MFIVKNVLYFGFDLIRLIFPTVGTNTLVNRQLMSMLLLQRQRCEIRVILQLLSNQALKFRFVVTVTVNFENRMLPLGFPGAFLFKLVDVAGE